MALNRCLPPQDGGQPGMVKMIQLVKVEVGELEQSQLERADTRTSRREQTQGPAGESRHKDQPERADTRTSWREQTQRPAGESRHKDQPERADTKTSRREQTQGPAGESRHKDQLERADTRTSWREQTQRPAGESRHKDQLERADTKTSRREQTQRPAGESRHKDQLERADTKTSRREQTQGPAGESRHKDQPERADTKTSRREQTQRPAGESRHSDTRHRQQTGAAGTRVEERLLTAMCPRIAAGRCVPPSPKRQHRTQATIFTFDTESLKAVSRCQPSRSSRRPRRVLYPATVRRYLPPRERDRTKTCLLLLCTIVALQIYTEQPPAKEGEPARPAPAPGLPRDPPALGLNSSRGPEPERPPSPGSCAYLEIFIDATSLRL
ncbi:peptidyl-prolyl cis-trans isomerase G-like [Heptranchias perlo]|uniref:peptidyl-prolyl cis-trans isomerase G-like n=1 Tax=Heptranchias perlo TaxID=212740 RepID=UPI0035596C0C